MIFDGYFEKKFLKVILKSKFKILFANIDYLDFSFKKIVKKKS